MPRIYTRKHIDLSGQRFGRLVVLHFDHWRGRRRYFLCQCDCGNTLAVMHHNLLNGGTRSCGCSRNIKNGITKHPLYHVWSKMNFRCYNPISPDYKNYSGRNIKVCYEWRMQKYGGPPDPVGFGNYAAHIETLGPRPSKYHSLDRINNNDIYKPGNMRWANPDEQRHNQSRN